MFHTKKNPKKLVLNLSSKQQQQKPPVTLNVSQSNIEDHHYKIHYQYGPARILPNLYLGASYNAENTQLLHRLDVTLIINVASEINITTPYSSKLEYHHIRWTHNQDNLDFNRVIKIIDTAHHKNQVVLVHCQQGIERSATLVLAYLIYLSRCHHPLNTMPTSNLIAGQNWSLDHALAYVQKRAPAIRPNMNQIYQLREYEKSMTVKRRARSGSVGLCNNNKLPVRKRAASVREFTTKLPWEVHDEPEEKNKVAAVLLVACMAIYHEKAS